MKRTATDKQFEVPTLPDLEDLCPTELRHGSTVKCRIIYRDSIESISFDAYTPRTILTLALAKLPEDFDYSYKYLRRHILDELRLASGCDEVLLYNSEGLLCDSSLATLSLSERMVYGSPQIGLFLMALCDKLSSRKTKDQTPQ